MENKWTFPHGKNLTPMGLNNGSIDRFSSNMIESLTREVVQNSLDAKDDDSNSPVKVTFEFKDIKTNSIPGIDTLKDVASSAIKFWEQDSEETIEYLNNFKKVITSDKVRVLKISDYHTTGLDLKAYKALVIGSGYTVKSSNDAAGSKGIGKFAPFANSDLRLVFYNTVSKSNDQKHVGVLNFVSFNCDDNDKEVITQERAHYQSEGKDHIQGQIDFGFGKRSETEYGTDLFLVGLKNTDEDWEKKILLSVVNNFLVSILDKKLIIKVNETELTRENVSKVISQLETVEMMTGEKNSFKNTKNYYDALTNPDNHVFNLDESFLEYHFIDDIEDATLILLEREDANRSILQTRSSGMKIFDQKRISAHINFTGVFKATGKNLSSFLRKLEDGSHTKWSVDQLSEDRPQAKRFLEDLFRWFKKTVKESYGVVVEDEIDAIGLSDFLPMMPQSDDADNHLKDSGLRRKVESIELKRKKSKKDLYDFTETMSDDEEKIRKSIEKAGYSESSDTDGNGDSSFSDSDGNNQRSRHKSSDNKNNGDSDRVPVRIGQDIVVKSIAMDSNSGKYRFILKSKKEIDEVELEFYTINDDGYSEKLQITTGESDTNEIVAEDGKIQVKNIKSNALSVIDVTTNLHLLVKVGVKIYEIR